MRYSELVLEHFFHPRNIGCLENDLMTGQAMLGNGSNGDLVQMSVKISEDRIIDTKFKAQASCPTIAVCSLLTQTILQATIEEAQKITSQQLMEKLSLPNIKMHCAILAVDALSAAIKDFKSKQDLK